MEGRNVGTIRRGKSPKQGIISAKDLPIELPEGTGVTEHESVHNHERDCTLTIPN